MALIRLKMFYILTLVFFSSCASPTIRQEILLEKAAVKTAMKSTIVINRKDFFTGIVNFGTGVQTEWGILTARHVTDGLVPPKGKKLIFICNGRTYKIKITRDMVHTIQPTLPKSPPTPYRHSWLPAVPSELALIKVRLPNVPFMGLAANVAVGEKVYVLGADPSVIRLMYDKPLKTVLPKEGTVKYLSNVDYEFLGYGYGTGSIKVAYLDTVKPGNSGGPIINEDGQLVGMLSAVEDKELCMGVSLAVIRDFLSRQDKIR